MRAWWSASDIAASGLTGLPATMAAASDWIGQVRTTSPELVLPRPGKGGGFVVALSALPPAARSELDQRVQTTALIIAESHEAADVDAARLRQLGPAVTRNLTARQRDVMEARAGLLIEIERRAMLTSRGKKPVAAELLATIKGGTAAPHLVDLARRANGRAGKVSSGSGATKGVCLRSVLGWFAAREAGGVAALAPALSRDKQPLPDWFEAFVPYYALPSKPALSDALEAFCRTLPPGHPRPSIDQVRRCINKLSALEHARGREGKVAIRRLQAYVSRDTSVLLPTSVYVADGTTADWEVAHPVHGRPFKPEITSVIDAATRACVGWSAGLSESTWVVADALRRAVGRFGVPAIFYSDRGPGYRNAAMDAPLTGILSRLGTHHDLTRPRNAQAKGNVERFQKLWVKVAKRFETYGGRDMDREARLAAFKTTRREIALFGASRILPDWADFVWAIEDEIDIYNNRPHRGLPLVRDSNTGRKRHMSPAEAWATHVANGFEAIIPEPAELEDLFRPYEIRRVSRCLISINTNSYFSLTLEEWHGRDVIVGYDIADGSKVWVREIDEVEGERRPGRMICIAAFEGNKRDYVPATKLQRAEADRYKGRVRRVQDRLDEIEAEHRPAALIEARPSRLPQVSGVARLISAPPSVLPTALALSSVTEPGVTAMAAAETLRPNPGRPRFADDVAFAVWILAHPDEATQTDIEFIRSELLDQTSQALLRHGGVDVEALRSLARQERAA